MKRHVLLLLVLSYGLASLAKTVATEQRTHYTIIDHRQATQFEVTAISTIGEDVSSETYLLKSHAGARLRIQVDRDHKNHKTTAEYFLDDRRAAKVKIDLPFTSGTLRGNVAESKAHPEFRNADIPITVESSKGAVKTSEKEWKADTAGAAHASVKKVVDESLASTVQAFLPVLAFPQIAGACSTVSFVSNGRTCAPDVRLAIGAMPQPNCQFDAEFGVPCPRQ